MAGKVNAYQFDYLHSMEFITKHNTNKVRIDTWDNSNKLYIGCTVTSGHFPVQSLPIDPLPTFGDLWPTSDLGSLPVTCLSRFRSHDSLTSVFIALS